MLKVVVFFDTDLEALKPVSVKDVALPYVFGSKWLIEICHDLDYLFHMMR